MRPRHIALAATVALLGAQAFAQTPPANNSMSGARPGHVPGVGASEPSSSRASNITPRDTKSSIAPTLPAPDLGMDASATEYVRAARASLMAGKTGQAQQALEMAETRLLDRVVPPGGMPAPVDSPMVSQIREARRALADGNSPAAMTLIDRALAG